MAGSRSLRVLAVFAALCVAMPNTATAGLLTYEGFDYTGTALAGQNGGFGFSGAWAGSFNHLTNDDVSLNSPAFLFAPVGSHIKGTGGSATRPVSSTFDFAQDGTLYVSALVQKPTGGSPKGDIFGYTSNNASRLFRIGIGGSSQLFATLGAETVAYAPGTMAQGDTYFVVAKIDALASGNDTIYLKVYGPNDTVDMVEPATWSAFRSADMNGIFSLLRIDFTDTPAVDEIRIGSTWYSVAVPEPTSLLLFLSLGVVATALRPLRHCKRK